MSGVVIKWSAVNRRIGSAALDGHDTIETRRCRHPSCIGRESGAGSEVRAFLGCKHREKVRSAVALIGEVDGLEVVPRWLAAVTVLPTPEPSSFNRHATDKVQRVPARSAHARSGLHNCELA
jgi:hypothetical protein